MLSWRKNWIGLEIVNAYKMCIKYNIWLIKIRVIFLTEGQSFKGKIECSRDLVSEMM